MSSLCFELTHVRPLLHSCASTTAPHPTHNMLAASRFAAFEPVSLCSRRVFAAPGLSTPRKHAVPKRVRVQAQEDNSTQTGVTQQQQEQPAGEEQPIWVQREKMRQLESQAKPDLPWPLYLLLSSFVAIASVGSVFEYLDKNALFGVVQPDSPLWAPILGLFAITGLPTAGFLFFKGVNAANEAAERQDKMDGYIK
eukprot:GHRQ01003640.1.p1 GENE.GHRQ01003640.1~~GHRQ01003640.1.p1  ORF type:complete len:196 (+),score=44.04 GHRQ01003640.1:25-612(+)